MSKDEMQAVLREKLAVFRAWSYEQLAERVGNGGEDGCLERVEGVGADGKQFFFEIVAVWDDQPRGNVRVLADLTAEPQRPWLGFLPIYFSDASDSFIKTPSGEFVDEG